MGKTVVILRGLPGSGKSTFADLISGGRQEVVCTADDYFMVNGEYKFDPRKLHDAHRACFDKFISLINNEEPLIVVANTGVRKTEFLQYMKNAVFNGYRVIVSIVENHRGGKSIHNVPDDTIESMRKNFEIYL